MRWILVLFMACAIVMPVVAYDLGTTAPRKPTTMRTPPPPDPEVIRQGGDTIADALLIYPYGGFWLEGTTTGYTDDYDEVCPYTGSTSPDVVYTFSFDYADFYLDIDMCTSSYDTKIYVYDEDLELVACNDDFYSDSYCGNWVSKIEQMPVEAGVDYYLVIDGYGGDYGDYYVAFYVYGGHGVECPAGAMLEEEPELVNEYVDLYNGGCNTPDAPGGPPFVHIAAESYCGVSGWYLFDGNNNRDTDWFTITLPADGTLEIIGDADQPTYMFELGPQDCDQVTVLQSVVVGPTMEGTLVLTGEPLSDVWFWIGPTEFQPPGGDPPQEYDWVIWLDDPVATESHSWSAVKGLFD